MNKYVTNYLVGWLFWVKWPSETVFQSISGRFPKRGRKKRKTRVKTSKQRPPAPTASTVGTGLTIS